MGLLTRTVPARERVEPRLAPLPAEARAALPWRGVDGWGVGALGSGGHGAVPAHLAENLSAITGAVELIAGAVASLPAGLQVDTADGRQPAPDTAPAWRVVERPNPFQSWPAFITSLIAGLLMHGNTVAMLGTDGRGAPLALTPVPWGWLNPQVVQAAAGPRLVYDVLHATPEAKLLGLPPRLLDTDVLHVRGRSDAGLIGRSVLSRAAGVIREGLEIATLAQANWQRGVRPSGYFTSPTILSPAQREQAQALIARYAGAVNAGKTPLLEGGWAYNQVTFNSTDAEFLASRRLSVEEIARLFSLPAAMLQAGQGAPDYAALIAAFGQLTLAPIVSLIEAEFDAAVLPPGMHLTLDMGGLLRGSYSALVSANSVAVQSGWLTANDARQAIGLPAVDGGDALRPNGAKAPGYPADAAGVPSLAPKPGPKGADGLPNVGTNENEGAG